jgi:hypothetical protein
MKIIVQQNKLIFQAGENATQRCICSKWKPNGIIMCGMNKGCATIQRSGSI